MSHLKTSVRVDTAINAPIANVWHCWVLPEHIVNWYFASDDWHTPKAENDLRESGKFMIRMESKNDNIGFDFEGTYTHIVVGELIEYALGDGRKVKIEFSIRDGVTHVVESFETEGENPVDMQLAGWQAILDNFKKYVEAGH